MNQLSSGNAELRFTIQITRKETGLVETYDMVGKVSTDDLQALTNEQSTQTEE